MIRFQRCSTSSTKSAHLNSRHDQRNHSGHCVARVSPQFDPPSISLDGHTTARADTLIIENSSGKRIDLRPSMTSPTYLRRPLRRRENHRASKEKTCPYNDIVYESDGDTEVQYYTSDESVDGSGGRKTQRRTLAESMVKAKQRGVTAARRGHDTLRRRGRESVSNLKQRGRSGVDGVRRRSKSLVARAPADRSGPSSGRRRSTFKVSSVISGKPLPQASAFGRKKEKKVRL